jgi:hypothetical protein
MRRRPAEAVGFRGQASSGESGSAGFSPSEHYEAD